MSRKELTAHIGDIKIGRKDDILHALLGSCVGIAILWPERGVYGLAHCLLAENPKKTFEISGRYVDQAITSLLILMRVQEKDYPKIQAVIAGGGNMTLPANSDPSKLVGTINSEMAFRCLKERKIKVIHSEIGGLIGRKITVDCLTGEFKIRKIPRNIAA